MIKEVKCKEVQRLMVPFFHYWFIKKSKYWKLINKR